MIVEYSAEHATFKASIHRWVEKIVVPRVAEVDFDRPLERAQWVALREHLRGHGIIDELPRTERGTADWVAFGILLEELARVEPTVAFLIAESLGTTELYRTLMTPAQQERFAHLLTGHSELVGAFTEADAGSNSSAVRTVARRTPAGGWLINGSKLWISGASLADGILVSCRTHDPVTGEDGAGLFLVEPGPGIKAAPISLLGLRGHPVSEVTFTDVPADPQDDLAGPKAFASLNRTLANARCFMAAISVGIAQGAVDLALGYAAERNQFGRPIASFQLVQDLLAGMATKVTLGRLLAFRALTVLTQASGTGVLESSMAKGWCTEMSGQVASAGIQVHGAIGLSTECRAEKFFRDARMMTIPDGTTQIQNLIIGRELTGISAVQPVAR